MVPEADYHDYVIKDGKFIGRFEEMYQNVADPWHHGQAKQPQYDLMLYLLRRFAVCSRGSTVFDIGCSQGPFTARLARALPGVEIQAVDIAPTAIQKAKDKYGALGINFAVMDIQTEYYKIEKKFDLIIMSQLMWYILPKFGAVVQQLLTHNLTAAGYLLISQVFYSKDKQKYGKEIVSSPEEMLQLVGWPPVALLELDRFTNHNVIALFRKT